jgi:hypothetical protein
MPIEGVQGAISALDALSLRITEAARKGAQDAGFMIEAAAKRNASGRPGPNVITGSLRRSIRTSPVAEAGPSRYVVEVAPHIIYGRIQELGGTITAINGPYLIWKGPYGWRQKESVTLKPHEYLRPAVEESRAGIYALAVKYFSEAVRG